MQVQVLQQRYHLPVTCRRLYLMPAAADPVHLHHQLQKLRPLQQRRAVATLAGGAGQQLEQWTHPAAPLVAVHIAEVRLRLPEAGLQIAVLRPQRRQIRRGDVQDHPLIEGVLFHLRPVDAAPPHQHEVPRRQVVPFAFDGVARLARQQNDDLVKRMIVVFNAFPLSVRQMKQPERLFQIAPRLIL